MKKFIAHASGQGLKLARGFAFGFALAALAAGPLSFLGCRAKKTKDFSRGLTPPAAPAWVAFDDLGELTALELRKTNPDNGAWELLRVTPKRAELSRSVWPGAAALELKPEVLKGLAASLRAAGRVRAAAGARGGLEYRLAWETESGRGQAVFDPAELRGIYAELTGLATRVMRDGR